MDETRLRLDVIEARLDAIERAIGLRREAPTFERSVPPPPPVVREPAPFPDEPSLLPSGRQPAVVPAGAASQPGPTAPSGPGLEYEIGAKLGPLLGAAAVLGAMGYLVSLGLTQGWIRPWMVFAAATVLCLAFVVVGLFKREEREEFGQILIGIGSCGLYLNFAAGYEFQDLYSGETLVGLFACLSLANLAYSSWRSSKAFLAIGLLGGFLAAMMPLEKEAVVLDLVLHFLILIPAAAIAARAGWARIAYGIGFLSLLALVPAALLGQGKAELEVVVAVYASALVALAAYVWTGGDQEIDPQNAGPALLSMVTTVAACLVINGPPATTHVVAFGLVLAVAGFGLGTRPMARPVLLAGALPIVTLAAIGHPAMTAAWLYVAIAIACAATSFLWERKAAAALALVAVGLGLGEYGSLLQADALAPSLEAGLVAAMLLAAGLSAWSLANAYERAEPILGLAAAVATPGIVRLVVLGVVSPAAGGSPELGIAAGVAVWAAVLAALALVSRWPVLSVLAGLLSAGGVLAYVFSWTGSRYDVAGDFLVLLLLAVAVTLAVGSMRSEGRRASVLGAAAFALGFVAVRFLFLVLAAVTDEPNLRIFASAAVVAGLQGWVSLRGPLPGVPRAAAGTWLVSMAAYWAIAYDRTTAVDVLSPLALLASLVLVFLAMEKEFDAPAVPWLAALAAWPVMGALGIQVAGPNSLGMDHHPSATTGWISHGLALLGVGFARETQAFRYASFLVLAGSGIKILLVDLEGANQVVKVVVLLMLGLVLLGGGYWYIRRQAAGADQP